MSDPSKERRKRRRWGDAPSSDTTTTPSNGVVGGAGGSGTKDAKAKAAALQQSISARLAALKSKKAQAALASKIASAPPSMPTATATATTSSNGSSSAITAKAAVVPPPTKKAKIYDFDFSVTGPSFKRATSGKEPVKKKINPYLAHLESESLSDGVDAIAGAGTGVSTKIEKGEKQNELDGEMLLDGRLAGGHIVKMRRRRKDLKFVEPGTFIEKAERKRARAENAEKSGFLSGRKVGTFVKANGMADVGDSVSQQQDGSSGAIGGNDNYYGNSSVSIVGTEDVAWLVKSVPRADVIGESLDGSSKSTGGVVAIPTPLVMEWWDVELLPSALKKEVISKEGKAMTNKLQASQRMRLKSLSSSTSNNIATQGDEEEDKKLIHDWNETEELVKKCFSAVAITNSKTSKLIQHPVPVKPPHAPTEDAPAPTLHLTKKEMKRQRKLRRAEKQRELQDLQAAGLIPAPEAKLTMSNFMRVLGDQAVMDPSKMEAKVMEQIQSRKLKHEKMNAERQLSKEQRAQKRERKLNEDTSQVVSVALFLVKDMSHRYHRTKVDLNAQQLKITGGVLECELPKMSLVICEGGPKAIKRITRLMLVRMKWKGEFFLENDKSDDDEDEVMNSQNKPQKVSIDNLSSLTLNRLLATSHHFHKILVQYE